LSELLLLLALRMSVQRSLMGLTLMRGRALEGAREQRVADDHRRVEDAQTGNVVRVRQSNLKSKPTKPFK
jgi:hypothetical protein